MIPRPNGMGAITGFICRGHRSMFMDMVEDQGGETEGFLEIAGYEALSVGLAAEGVEEFRLQLVG